MTNIYNILAAGVSLILSLAIGAILIPILRKIEVKQTINEIGPAWHEKKQGTPTMGGIMFIISTTLAVVVGCVSLYSVGNVHIATIDIVFLVAGLCLALLFGLIGFVDDYISVVKKRNLGLTEIQKLIMQFIIIGLFLLTINIFGATQTSIIIPFLGPLELGFFYYPFMMIFAVGFVNAVNLTDGVDGLSSSVTFFVATTFVIIGGIESIPTLSIYGAALAGGLIGFLFYNFYPAKIFMGDTGSMFMGGCVVAFSFASGMPLTLILAGIIYLWEIFSVILQIIAVKTLKRRIFKMTPIHHSFEIRKFSEISIVVLFSGIAIVGCALAVLAIILT